MSDPTKHIYIRLKVHRELGDLLKDMAHCARNSVNGMIIRLLEEALGDAAPPRPVLRKPSQGLRSAGTTNIVGRSGIPLTELATKIPGAKETAVAEMLSDEELNALTKAIEKLKALKGAANNTGAENVR